MALLNIKPSKKITFTCTIEESTMLLVDHYAAFLHRSGDGVIDAALEHVFNLDKEFQQYLTKHKDAPAPSSLRAVKKTSSASIGLRRGRKPTLAIAN